MRTLLTLVVVLCLTPLVRGSDEECRARAALALAQAFSNVLIQPAPAPPPPAPPKAKEYLDYYKEAMADGKNLIVWVGVFPAEDAGTIENSINMSTAKFYGDGTPRVIVGKYAAGKMYRIDLPSTAGLSDIREALTRPFAAVGSVSAACEGCTDCPNGVCAVSGSCANGSCGVSTSYPVVTYPSVTYPSTVYGGFGGFGSSCASGSCSSGSGRRR